MVSATGAAGTVIDRDAVAHALSMRDGRPLVLLDLAVPRDVDPGTDEPRGARVIDIVSLRHRLAELDAATADDITSAQRIVADEVRRFWCAVAATSSLP